METICKYPYTYTLWQESALNWTSYQFFVRITHGYFVRCYELKNGMIKCNFSELTT